MCHTDIKTDVTCVNNAVSFHFHINFLYTKSATSHAFYTRDY